MLDLDKLEVLRDRTVVEDDDKVDVRDFVERLEIPEFEVTEGRASGPRLSTSHLQLP